MKKSGSKIPDLLLSLAEQKRNRKASNAANEKQRIIERDMMESMSLEQIDDGHAPLTTRAGPRSSGDMMVRDSFGNTISKAKLESDKLIEKQRTEAKLRREAKLQRDTDECVAPIHKPKDDRGLSSQKEELQTVFGKLQLNEKLSNREKKLLKRHEEESSAAALEEKERNCGLASFSLSIGGGYSGGTDEDETASSVDVIVPNFTITAPHRTLFRDASLRLVSGRRYGLLGPNGRGKSTLLKYLAARQLPVPEGLDVLLVEQDVCASDDSVIDQVLAADVLRTRLLKEEEELISRIDSFNERESETADADVAVDDYFDQDIPPSSSYTHAHREMQSMVARVKCLGDELDAIGAYSRQFAIELIT